MYVGDEGAVASMRHVAGDPVSGSRRDLWQTPPARIRAATCIFVHEYDQHAMVSDDIDD